MEEGRPKRVNFYVACVIFYLFIVVGPPLLNVSAPAFGPRMPSWFGNGTGHGSDLIGSTSDIVNPAYRNFMAGYSMVLLHTKDGPIRDLVPM